jgi:hypothetical protein
MKKQISPSSHFVCRRSRGTFISSTILLVLMLVYLPNMKLMQQLMPLLEEREQQNGGGILVAPDVVVPRYMNIMERGAVITSATMGSAPPTFCQRWSPSDAFNRSLQPFDLWHTHHPNWVVTEENDSMFCLAEVGSGSTTHQQHPYIRNLLLFYTNQFYSPCSILHKRTMWFSGWGASFRNMQNGLIHALYYHVPFFVEGWQGYPWNYAANKDDYSNVTCPAGDTTCYFLPYHGCTTTWNISTYASMLTLDSNVTLLDEALPDQSGGSGSITDDWGWSAYLFMTRKQLWLRRAMFDCKENFRQANSIAIGSECSVVHVRRADVVLLDDGRKYFPVADYIKMIPDDRLNDANHYILLLTDDSNAIDEAHKFFPNLKWAYLDRPRFKGSSGGWENHSPSRNPALETIFLLTELELAMACSVIVNGESGFSRLIYRTCKWTD